MRPRHLRCCHATRKSPKIFATGLVVTNLLGQVIAIPRNTAQTLVKTRCSVSVTGSVNGLNVLEECVSMIWTDSTSEPIRFSRPLSSLSLSIMNLKSTSQVLTTTEANISIARPACKRCQAGVPLSRSDWRKLITKGSETGTAKFSSSSALDHLASV